MQKTTVNPNPEQEMTVNPFAQEQAAEIQPQENAQTYPVEVDGDIVELTLEELIDAAAQGLSKRNAYIRRNRAANAMQTALDRRYGKTEPLVPLNDTLELNAHNYMEQRLSK